MVARSTGFPPNRANRKGYRPNRYWFSATGSSEGGEREYNRQRKTYKRQITLPLASAYSAFWITCFFLFSLRIIFCTHFVFFLTITDCSVRKKGRGSIANADSSILSSSNAISSLLSADLTRCYKIRRLRNGRTRPASRYLVEGINH